MGNRIRIDGRFAIDPPLAEERRAYLARFASTRRVRRAASSLNDVADPVRIAAGLPVGEEGCYFTGGADSDALARASDASVVDDNRPPADQPSLWCPWTPTGDGRAIVWNEVEKPTHLREWLDYLVRHFLDRWGHALSGQARWEGELSDDGWGLIDASREGVRSRKGKGNRPSLIPSASIRPALFPQLRPVAMGRWEGQAVACALVGGSLVGALRQGNDSLLLVWDDLEQAPRELAKVAGVVERIVVDPTCTRLAMLSVRRKPNCYGSTDPAELIVLGHPSGAESPWKSEPGVSPLANSEIVWSSDGAAIAFGALHQADHRRSLRIVDADSGELLHQVFAADCHAAITPLAHDPAGWLFAVSGRTPALCAPHDRREPRACDRIGSRSPDGRFEVCVEQAGLTVTSSSGEARFLPFPNADFRAGLTRPYLGIQAYRPCWLHPDRVAVHGENVGYVVDLEQLTVQLLFAGGGMSLKAASGSEPLVIAIDPSWRFVHARFDPQQRARTPRVDSILGAVERGATMEFTELAGRSAVRVVHPDGTKQISVLADDERTILEALGRR